MSAGAADSRVLKAASGDEYILTQFFKMNTRKWNAMLISKADPDDTKFIGDFDSVLAGVKNAKERLKSL